jgi:hypothetical protein
LKKPWILLAQSKDDLTFDISPNPDDLLFPHRQGVRETQP